MHRQLICINAALSRLRQDNQSGRSCLGPALVDLGMTEIERQAIGIVDDDQAVRDSLRLLLEVVGHPVETFASAAEFLAAGPRVLACLILDHHMPQMTGLQLAEKLHADGSSIPILLVTGLPSPAIVAQAAQLDIRVLEKPPDEDGVLDFINATRS